MNRLFCSPFGRQCDITAAPRAPATKWCSCYNARYKTVANSLIVPIRHAQPDDLPAIVAIYNASIPGRMATADTEARRDLPGSLESRQAAVTVVLGNAIGE